MPQFKLSSAPRRWSQLLLLCWTLVVGLPACGGAAIPTIRRGPTVGVFAPQLRKVPLDRRLVATLHRHATRLLRESDAFTVLAHDELEQRLAKRRRRRERVCRSLRCQRRLGKKALGIARSLNFTLSRSKLGSCVVTARLFELADKRPRPWLAGRAPGECDERGLRRSFDRVVCYLIAEKLAGRAGPAPEPPPRASAEADCLALAELVHIDAQVDMALERPSAPRRSRRRRPLGPWEQQHAEDLLTLKRAYRHLVENGGPRFRLVARCRQGWLYERFAAALERAGSKPPRTIERQGKAAVARFVESQRASLAQRTAPYRRKAAELYRDCLARAKQAGVPEDRHLRAARQRLDKL